MQAAVGDMRKRICQPEDPTEKQGQEFRQSYSRSRMTDPTTACMRSSNIKSILFKLRCST